MNCKRCDYPLWNLRTRRCPECGEPFAPSDFRFAINSVQFCCPHCGQDYYGTDADGHLFPRTFDCVSCAQRIDMDDMVLLPTSGVEERRTRPDINPWLDKRRRRLSRLAATLARGMTNPVWLIRSTPIETPPGSAWSFALLTQLLVGAVLMLPPLGFGLLIAAISGGGLSGMLGFGVVWTLFYAIASLLYMAVWAAVAHLILSLGGPTAGGMRRTEQAICYTCGPQLIALVPCIGPYFAWAGALWWTISAGFALAAAQKVSGRRAALAIGAVPAVCAALAVAALAMLFASSVSFSATGPVSWSASASPSLDQFVQPVRDAIDSGRYPAHAAEWIGDASLLPAQFVSPNSSTMPTNPRVMGIVLDRLGELRPVARASVISAAVAALPAPGAPHRIGDYVFALDALPHAQAQPSLWVAIEAWDPQFNPGAPQTFHVLAADGSIRTIPGPALPAMLDMQNQTRAAVGLAPLPHPQTIRAAEPPGPGGP